jgi:creatinine amidohydrolase
VTRLEELAWPEVRAALEAGTTTVLFGVGAVEQHGPHLPLITDALVAEVICERIARRLPGVLVGPTLQLGVSPHHLALPGTLSLSEQVFTDQVLQYAESLASHGFESVLVVSGHGGNVAPLERLRDRTGGKAGTAELVPYTDLTSVLNAMVAIAAEDGISAEVCGAHAGDFETSMVLALRPDLVNLAVAAPGFLGGWTAETSATFFEHGVTALDSNGVIGDPTRATAARGERYLQALEDLMVEFFL